MAKMVGLNPVVKQGRLKKAVALLDEHLSERRIQKGTG